MFCFFSSKAQTATVFPPRKANPQITEATWIPDSGVKLDTNVVNLVFQLSVTEVFWLSQCD